MYRNQRFGSRAVSLGLLVLLSSTLFSGCSMMSPGNVGWFCESSDDCKDGLKCLTYTYAESDNKNKLCTGKKRLTDTSSNYGWTLMIAAWLFAVVLPGIVVIMIVVARIRDRGRPDAPPPAV